MNEPMRKTEPAAISSVEFFERARARLRFEVPPGLTRASVGRMRNPKPVAYRSR